MAKIKGKYNKGRTINSVCHLNGTVDLMIGGDFDKIGIDKEGMITLIKEWLNKTSKHEIKQQEREELISLLRQ